MLFSTLFRRDHAARSAPPWACRRTVDTPWPPPRPPSASTPPMEGN